jgi:hypothetical protein
VTPETRQRPARQCFAGIPLPLAVLQDTVGAETLPQPPQQPPGHAPFVRTVGCGVPLGPVHVVDRNERRLATHGQTHIGRGEIAVDLMSELVDRQPLLFAVGLGDARILAHSAYLVVVVELDVALVDAAGHRRGGGRIGRTGQRNVTFAGEQP